MTRARRRPARRTSSLLAILLGACLAAGCSVSPVPEARLTGTSLAADPTSLTLDLSHGCYADQPAELSFFLSDRTLEELTEGGVENAIITHAQLLWSPMPGSTPVDPTATNVVIRVVLLTNGELGIYGGAGFAWPSGTPGKTAMKLELVGSTLTLLHSTEGFRDLLSPFLLLGTLRAPYAPVETLRFRQSASQLVTDLLGETQWVAEPIAPWSHVGAYLAWKPRLPQGPFPVDTRSP